MILHFYWLVGFLFLKGYNANRPAPKSVESPESEVTRSSIFEVRTSDFPELSEHPISQVPQLCWGSVKSPQNVTAATNKVKK